MKKIILIVVALFTGVTSSFAYNNGVGIMAASPESGMGYPSQKSEYININSYCQVYFSCSYTNAGIASPPVGSAYLKHGGSTVHFYNFGSGTGNTGLYTDYWYTLELGIACNYNAIGLVQLNW
jgi:hypothetical protein